MKYSIDYFQPNQNNDDKQYYLYVEGDKTRRVCLLLNEFNTEYAAKTIASILNKASTK